jgi:hypothetical protein
MLDTFSINPDLVASGRGLLSATPNLVLDLNFMGGVLPSLVTVTRALSATYANSSGILSTASSNVGREDYDPTTLALNGLLRETAATNLTLHSDMASGWTFTSASFTQAAATGPDGIVGSAVKLVEAAATSSHFGGIGALTIVAGSTNTYSVWLKAAERSTAQIQFTDGALSTGFRAFLNLATGVVTSTSTLGTGTVTGSGVKAYPNGWYRFWVTGTIDPATTTTARSTIQISNGSYVGDGTSGIFCYGSQPEAGALATSYTPTTAATVTRPADVLTVPVSAFAYNPFAGTIVASVIPAVVADLSRAVWEINDGTANNRIQGRLSVTTGVGTFLMVAGGVTVAQFSTGNSASAGALTKHGMAWANADGAVALNGGAVATSAGGTPLPTGITTLRLGDSIAANQGFSGWLQRYQIRNVRSSNAQLQALEL